MIGASNERAGVIGGGLETAWMSARADYRDGRVNSERTLQASLFRHLHVSLPECVIFCEPVIRMAEGGSLVPDMLIASGAEIVAVVELKFVPHDYPVFEEDVRKLNRFASHLDQFPVSLEPETGTFRKELHHFATDCILVFAAIGRDDAEAMNSDLLRSQITADSRGRFLHLCHSTSRARK